MGYSYINCLDLQQRFMVIPPSSHMQAWFVAKGKVLTFEFEYFIS